MSDFYPKNDYRNYLQHHGIKGQHWGEQNGPPYPLSTKIHNMVVKGRERHKIKSAENKEKRRVKRRTKILHDPKKLKKHMKEFSKEEIDSALAKLESVSKIDKYIPKKQKSEKQIAKEKKQEQKRVSKKIDKYGRTPGDLLDNSSKFSNEELKLALDRVKTKEQVFDVKIDRINRPKKYLDTGVGYLNSILSTVNAVKGIKDLFKSKYNKYGQSEQDINIQKTIKRAMATGDFTYILSNKNATDNVIKALSGGKGKGKGNDKDAINFVNELIRQNTKSSGSSSSSNTWSSEKEDQLRNLGKNDREQKTRISELESKLAELATTPMSDVTIEFTGEDWDNMVMYPDPYDVEYITPEEHINSLPKNKRRRRK